MKASSINFEIRGIEQFASPVNSMVVIEKVEMEKKEEKTKSGLFIPDSAKESEEDMLYAYGYVHASDDTAFEKGNIVAYCIAHGVTLVIPNEREKSFAIVPGEHVYSIITP